MCSRSAVPPCRVHARRSAGPQCRQVPTPRRLASHPGSNTVFGQQVLNSLREVADEVGQCQIARVRVGLGIAVAGSDRSYRDLAWLASRQSPPCSRCSWPAQTSMRRLPSTSGAAVHEGFRNCLRPDPGATMRRGRANKRRLDAGPVPGIASARLLMDPDTRSNWPSCRWRPTESRLCMQKSR